MKYIFQKINSKTKKKKLNKTNKKKNKKCIY